MIYVLLQRFKFVVNQFMLQQQSSKYFTLTISVNKNKSVHLPIFFFIGKPCCCLSLSVIKINVFSNGIPKYTVHLNVQQVLYTYRVRKDKIRCINKSYFKVVHP